MTRGPGSARVRYEDRVEAHKILPLVEAAIDDASLGTLRAVAELLGLNLTPKNDEGTLK